jgi:alkyl sulfatase BDS1-like metallo-beta-lactamase superfamily hydrolase
MRSALEKTVGRAIQVAAILYTHWHYTDGTTVWLDKGAEIWGHELLDANRKASSGVSIESGFYRARAVAQFGVLHPLQGPDAFPNRLGFTIEKLMAVSGYVAPSRFFRNGLVDRLEIAGEEVNVMPNRTDTSDSVGFFFPKRKTLISNFMVPGGFFNIYSLRGGPFRNPVQFLEDARFLETHDAQVLLDLHSAPIIGEEAVRKSIQRAADQVQIIHDQTLRWIARGFDGREAAERIYIPAAIRDGWENYGQVESHVRQVYNGTVGWFGHDVYDINPLSVKDEASRLVALAGGVDRVRQEAASAVRMGGLANWRWVLRLTTLLLQAEAGDAEVRRLRASAARALAQRTTSANARGWYMTEAMELDGSLMLKDQPVSMDLVRAALGTPSLEDLIVEPVSVNLDFLRFLVDPRLAEGKDMTLHLDVDGEDMLQVLTLRNGVLLLSVMDARNLEDTSPIRVSRTELAEFVLGELPAGKGGDAVDRFQACLDRSELAWGRHVVSSIQRHLKDGEWLSGYGAQ